MVISGDTQRLGVEYSTLRTSRNVPHARRLNASFYCACAKLTTKMEAHLALLVAFAAATVLFVTVQGETGLQIGVLKRPDTCEERTKNGDRLSMHYTVRSI